MGWAGRREAKRTPTDEQLAIMTTLRNANSKAGATGWDLLSARKRRPSEIRIRERAHTDQASHAAARVPIPPIPRPRSLAPSVTTPLYKTIAFRISRRTPHGAAVGVPRRSPFARGCSLARRAYRARRCAIVMRRIRLAPSFRIAGLPRKSEATGSEPHFTLTGRSLILPLIPPRWHRYPA